MTPHEILEALAARGVTLLPDGDALIAMPASRLTPADRELIRAHKQELIAALSCRRTKCPVGTDTAHKADLDAALGAMHQELARFYVQGALAWGLTQADLADRFRVTEEAIDAAAARPRCAGRCDRRHVGRVA